MKILTVKDNNKTPAHLRVLGYKCCQKCGNTLSVNNTTCYRCDFEPDDVQLNEVMLNNKHIKQWNNTDIIVLGKPKVNTYNKNIHKNHLFINGSPFCNYQNNNEPYQFVFIREFNRSDLFNDW